MLAVCIAVWKEVYITALPQPRELYTTFHREQAATENRNRDPIFFCSMCAARRLAKV